MSEYNELIKNFGRIRDYMRDFFVFGFKTRSDFSYKSKRTYDNERRRVENYLGDFLRWDYSNSGKRVFLSVDSSKITQNPFYRAYKSKSFTINDIVLHFLIIDILTGSEWLSLDDIVDKVNEKSLECFEPQTVRNKLKEYSGYGIVEVKKEKKAYFYSLGGCFVEKLGISEDAVVYFSEVAPFGVIGSYIADRMNLKNTKFVFKHHFIVNTLEDNILLDIIAAIFEGKRVEIENYSKRDEVLKKLDILPLMIYISVQTGRRYVVAQAPGKYRFAVYRLDYIKNVKILDRDENFQYELETLRGCGSSAFSTALMKNIKPEHFEMTLYINEETEDFVIKRLEREGRGGHVEKIEENIYKYSVDIYDTNELTTWIKTFTGRIIKLEGDNKRVIQLFYEDIKTMTQMYVPSRGEGIYE